MSPDRSSIDEMQVALRVRHGPLFWLRVLLQCVFGTVAALALAWFMNYLIYSSDLRLDQASRLMMLDFVRVKREEQVERKRRTPARPQLTQAPEVPQLRQSSADPTETSLQVSAMPATTEMSLPNNAMGFAAGEGDYLPIVKVAPVYPHVAMMKGIEGECLVRYTVSASGTVKDVEVIRDECTDPVFHRPSIDAARRFKYKPRVIDGVAIEVTGVYNMFYYNVVDKSD